MKTHLSLLAAVLLVAPVAANAVDYQKEILPIFKRQCIKCHGNEEAKGRFNLEEGEIEKHIKKSGEIRPGNAERSDLYECLIEEDEEDRMPPKKPPLPAEQIALIKQWIDEGALLGNEEKKEGEEDSPEKEAADSPEKAAAEGMEKPEPITGTWTNNKGQKMQATLTAVNGDQVMFRMPNGSSVSYPIANLAPESQEKVKAFAGAIKTGEE